MNYRHAFHAGNFADVVKHVVLTRIVEYLKRKEAAFRVIDTHAGAGLFDLSSPQAQRTGEWREGIARLLAATPQPAARELIAPYLEVVGEFMQDEGPARYPGSPMIVRRLLRRQDRLTAIEKHPEEAAALASLFAGDYQVRVIELDGWLALGAHLPPKERRGLVLVDPPFEKEGEFDRLLEGLVRAHRRWLGGTYALWYPVKHRPAVEAFRKGLRATAIAGILDVDFRVRAAGETPSLDGCGMAIVNPPFVLARELDLILPAIAEALAESSAPAPTAQWLTPAN